MLILREGHKGMAGSARLRGASFLQHEKTQLLFLHPGSRMWSCEVDLSQTGSQEASLAQPASAGLQLT